MAVSEVSICNLALGWVGGNLIASLDDPSKEAQLCKVNYPTLRDAVIEAGDWTFAMRRENGGAPVVPDAGTTSWGYTHAFAIDPDFLRLIYVGQSDRPQEDDPVEDWVREGGRVLTNSPRVFVRGVVSVTDTSLFSALFVQALAARLAMDFAIPVSHSRSLQADMTRLYNAKFGEALSQDNKQGRSRVMRARGMQMARRAGTTGGIVGPVV